MEMRNGSDVPRIAGQGARAETVHVVDEISDDHFDKFLGQPRGKRRAHCRGLRRRVP